MSLMPIYKRWCVQLPLRWLISRGQNDAFLIKCQQRTSRAKNESMDVQPAGEGGGQWSSVRLLLLRFNEQEYWHFFLPLGFQPIDSGNCHCGCDYLENLHVTRRTNACETEAALVEFQLNWSLMVPTLSPVRALQWRQGGRKKYLGTVLDDKLATNPDSRDLGRLRGSHRQISFKNVLFMFDWATFNLCGKSAGFFFPGNLKTSQEKKKK